MITKKVDKAHKKVAQNKLTFADVRRAARDGLRAFDNLYLLASFPLQGRPEYQPKISALVAA